MSSIGSVRPIGALLIAVDGYERHDLAAPERARAEQSDARDRDDRRMLRQTFTDVAQACDYVLLGE
jgi:hypothetical protein